MSMRALYDVPAPAKLNLFLHVVGRRADGYHLLQSVFVLIDWCDTLHFERARRRPARPPRPRRRAARRRPLPARRARCCRRQRHARSAPTSRSTSACPRAPAWAAAAPTPPRPCSRSTASGGWTGRCARLLPLGLALGADVPFFLGGRNAWVEGIGERLTPLTLPPAWFAVVKPARRARATRGDLRQPALVRDSVEAAIIAGFPGRTTPSTGFGRGNRAGTRRRLRAKRPAGRGRGRCPEVAQAAPGFRQRSATAG